MEEWDVACQFTPSVIVGCIGRTPPHGHHHQPCFVVTSDDILLGDPRGGERRENRLWSHVAQILGLGALEHYLTARYSLKGSRRRRPTIVR